MIDFLRALGAVERSAKVRFCDDSRGGSTTMLVGVHYGDDAVLTGLDNAHSAIRPGTVSIGTSKVRVLGAARERDLDKRCAAYLITTELLSEGQKASLRELMP